MTSSVLLLLHPLMASEPNTVEETKKRLQSQHPDQHLSQYVIDRVATGKQTLPEAAFSLIHYLAPDGARKNKFNGSLAESLFNSLVPNGVFEGLIPDDSNVLAIKVGFLVDQDGTRWIKPGEQEAAVPLRRVKPASPASAKSFGLPSFKRSAATSTATPNLTDSGSENLDDDNDYVEAEMDEKLKQSKLVYFENSDSDEITDEQLYDEDKLLDAPGLSRPTVQPIKSCGRTGKRRRRACKDCTCGLKEEEEREDERQRSVQENLLAKISRNAVQEAEAIEKRTKRKLDQKKGKVVKFKPEEMNEIDFTVEGKKGGCGSCALGDAFRCDGCPYLGLPAFKPGMPISLEGMAEDI